MQGFAGEAPRGVAQRVGSGLVENGSCQNIAKGSYIRVRFRIERRVTYRKNASMSIMSKLFCRDDIGIDFGAANMLRQGFQSVCPMTRRMQPLRVAALFWKNSITFQGTPRNDMAM